MSRFGFGERKALIRSNRNDTIVLRGLAHGGKIGLCLQNGFASAPLLNFETRQPLLLIATEPIVGKELAVAKLLNDPKMGAVFCFKRNGLRASAKSFSRRL